MDLLQSNRKITVKLSEFNDLLTCSLCKGYWIRPTTIAECLHTFCRSCIVQYIDDSDENQCPKCHTVIHETNPLELLRADQTLEDIIFKLVPHLQESEKQREISFNQAEERKRLKEEETVEKQPIQKQPRTTETRDEQEYNDHRNDPQIAFCLDCINNDEVSSCKYIQPLARKFIKTSIRLTIGHLKKYLRLKLNLPNKKEVDILCNGEIMGKDHTLEFIYMTRWRLKSEHLLTLQYRSQEVLLT